MMRATVWVCLWCLVVAAASVQAQDPPKDPPKEAAINVTGEWDVTVETPQGAMTSVTTFKQEGEKLTGMVTGPRGELPLDGAVKGADIVFAVQLDMQGQAITIGYMGKIDGGTMSGTIEFGSFGTSTWTAKRRR